jgi:phosphatidylserine decarboxylase
MKHAGEARRAAHKLIFLALVIALVLAFFARAILYALLHSGNPAEGKWWNITFLPIWAVCAIAVLWAIFAGFTLYFFRDPNAKTPTAGGLVVSPGHGKVDVVDRLDNVEFMGGSCHRISIFLSVIDIHVQNAPISGKINCLTHTSGKFISALRTDCSLYNENVLIGFESTELIGEKIGLRLIAGVLARRIVPFVKVGDDLARGERVSLIQFGSRCDLYIPLRYEIRVKIGDRVVGGETIMAAR